VARPRRPFAFFALVFALSTPFWIVGWIKSLQLLPGLPVSAIMSLTPVMAAAILSYQEGGTSGVLALLGRAFDLKRVRPVWYIPAVLLMLSLTLLSYCLMRLLRLPLPRPEIPLATGLLLFIPLLVGGLAEELG
jgi:CAAX protease family protein